MSALQGRKDASQAPLVNQGVLCVDLEVMATRAGAQATAIAMLKKLQEAIAGRTLEVFEASAVATFLVKLMHVSFNPSTKSLKICARCRDDCRKGIKAFA